ncbi:MAG: hypothetical protein IPO63_10210 [Bacteroidetes bacterium]|nr:hypothetical protein [Bacteroidota bacterium]
MNICAKKSYEVNGEEKITWYKIGVLKITDNNRMYLRLFMHPQTEFSVFENKAGIQD